ncbi:Sensitivity To Red Light Reduced-like SRR1 [Penicillium malachiteum]|uniref:Sensitivity To Red Light Reduced-like SRR1 n=1 Tax=Penicillium malachiteum TaxID=1324776 RepID=A0AAD6MRQ2_9EURO|nr:Sensitivity To Red Light Reduced-like SRR1 [Penicillium malachiteum]
MPHTSRPRTQRNQPSQKRLEITSDDGWTHVTTGNNARRVNRNTRNKTQEAHVLDPVLQPAEAPARLTLDDLRIQYSLHRSQWVESETWNGIESVLAERISRRVQDGNGLDGRVDGIVCIGLGSLSGFLRDGWVDRRDVSMYQLAALESIRDLVVENTSVDSKVSVSVYLQDPVFNKLDCALLESLGMTVVNHPEAFERVTRNTLLFCPGAERKHLEQILPSNPGLLFGGPLENTESDVIQAFIDRTGSRILAPFKANEHAFWMTRFYWTEENSQP